MSIEFTKPVLPAIRKPFCDTHWVHQACLFYSHIKPKKTAFLGGTHWTYKRRWINAKIHIDVFWPATYFELNCGSTYVFTKKTSISTFCFKAKKSDKLARELWPINLHREPLIWPCWLRIAHLFWPDWFDCITCLPKIRFSYIYIFFVSLRDQDTSRKGWVYKCYKSYTKSFARLCCAAAVQTKRLSISL